MYLGKRYWAERAVQAAGVPAGDPVGIELTDMLVLGAEQCHRQFRAHPDAPRVDDLDCTMISARAMPTSPSARRRIGERYALDEEMTTQLLSLVRKAAFEVFEAQGRKLPASNA